MLTQSQSDRLARKCTAALTQAIDAFPNLLAQSDPEAAAAIVADLIKAQLNRPETPPDPAAALQRVIESAANAVSPNS